MQQKPKSLESGADVIGRTFICLLLGASLSGCGPLVNARVMLPAPGGEAADTAGQITLAIEIAGALAATHGLTPSPSRQEWRLRRFTGKVQPPDPHDLTLQLIRPSRRARLEYVVTESAATWSASGDSLRRALEDTLRAHFGDSLSVDTVSVPATAGPYFVVPLALGVIAFAPPAGLLIIDGDSIRSTSRWPDHFAVRVEGGISGKGQDESTYSATSIAARLWRGWFFGEISLDRLAAVSYDWHYMVRGGYLWRPHPLLRTGVTLGYRDADWSTTGDRAVLIGLPLHVGGDKAVIRIEPLYVASSGRLGWAYRFEVDYTGHPNFHPGFSVTLRDNVFIDRGALAIAVGLNWRP